jgi:hypothetical protein
VNNDPAEKSLLTPEVLETARGQAEADAALMAQLQEKLKVKVAGGELRPALNRAERRAIRRRPNRTKIFRPMDARGRRRIQREARILAGITGPSFGS